MSRKTERQLEEVVLAPSLKETEYDSGWSGCRFVKW